MPKEDIYGRLFKPYGTKPQYTNDKGQISLYAFNNHTLQQLLSFSKNFSRIMDYENVIMKKQTTTTHQIYTFYEDKKKTKTYILTTEDLFIQNEKGEKNIIDPYIYRIAYHEKILQFKKVYTSISDWFIQPDGIKMRLELNTATLEKYRHFKSKYGSVRTKEKYFQQTKNVLLIEKLPRYTYEHFLTEIKFRPETLNKSSIILAKQFGTKERTIRNWKSRFKAVISY